MKKLKLGKTNFILFREFGNFDEIYYIWNVVELIRSFWKKSN